ncbi:MAG TPA: alkaline phosphatase [Burkholderiales bacterium]|nr:alkaline phosphatase [Burkholderiales bacterium]
MDLLKKTSRGYFTLPRLLFALLSACALVVTGCAGIPAGGNAQAPKNIIIMFADGAASTQWELGKYSARHLRNESFAVTDVVFREGTLGMLSTHPANALVTDSAAAATAMSTGSKTNNDMIGMTPDGKPLRTLMETAKASGKRIGLVTTSTVHDASPAAFSVHARSRRDSQVIVDQMLALEPDVLMGGGRDYFLPQGTRGGKRIDGKDVVAAFAAKGYQVVQDPIALHNASGPRLLALFADHYMDFEIDRDPTREPSTAEMAAAALRLLSANNPNGFVLFVENESIDTAGHHNDAAALIRDLWAFDAAVQIALDFQRRAHRDTLIIVTGDHETGGLSVTSALKQLAPYSTQNYFYPDKTHLKMIMRIKSSLSRVAEVLGAKPSSEMLDKIVSHNFPGFILDSDLRAAILDQQPIERNVTYSTEGALGRMIARQTGFYWGTTGHTTEPVMVGAIGPGADLFRGYQDNTDFGKHLHRLINGR